MFDLLLTKVLNGQVKGNSDVKTKRKQLVTLPVLQT